VTLHDCSTILLKKLGTDYDPTDRWQAMRMLEEAQQNNWLMTGLIYIDPSQPSLFDRMNLSETPLNEMDERTMRPSRESLDEINQLMF
jgi:2-oxoglutarate ferredoxin oxidoreductase subunit beta